MPRFSSSLINPASEYLAGGSVCFSVEFISKRLKSSPDFNSGKITSSLADLGSALNQPSKTIREPLSQKSGYTEVEPPLGGSTSKSRLVTTFVRIVSADFIWLDI